MRPQAKHRKDQPGPDVCPNTRNGKHAAPSGKAGDPNRCAACGKVIK